VRGLEIIGREWCERIPCNTRIQITISMWRLNGSKMMLLVRVRKRGVEERRGKCRFPDFRF
jgi:hypothetical protein